MVLNQFVHGNEGLSPAQAAAAVDNYDSYASKV